MNEVEEEILRTLNTIPDEAFNRKEIQVYSLGFLSHYKTGDIEIKIYPKKMITLRFRCIDVAKFYPSESMIYFCTSACRTDLYLLAKAFDNVIALALLRCKLNQFCND